MFDVPFIIALVVSVTAHEFSHAWAATILGDPTPRMQGRLSLNPLRHLDPVGTLMLFVAHIGWGKPVPYNPGFLRHPVRDSALIALAGPLMNIVIALMLVFPIRVVYTISGTGSFSWQLLLTAITLNIVLAIFNLLPFPPLDGSKILFSLLPAHYRARFSNIHNYGYIFLIVLLLMPYLIKVDILGLILNPLLSRFWELALLGL
jgi:Zn-dependent protease